MPNQFSLFSDPSYATFFEQLKEQIRAAQVKAALYRLVDAEKSWG